MMSYSPEGFLINTKENRQYIANAEGLQRACNEGIALEQRVTYCDCKHNLHVELGEFHGIIPREECAVGITDGTVKDIAIIARVNKPVRFVVERLTTCDGKKTAILSRRRVQQDFIDDCLPCIAPGDVIDASITHLESFGAFCDIGCGVNALLPIDNISVSRIPHPNVRFSVGDNIKAVVKSLDEAGRITLSHKELLGTWSENAQLFSPGETVSGVIRSIENYGIFVELTPNLSGLAEYTSDVYEGQQASVFIKSIIPDKMKFKLIIVDAFDADYPKSKPFYFINDGHLDEFCYSPPNCAKVIKTEF
ncbi:MAG: S1 RNA-binding domain-containing protein [Clostridia bacterium]|nr:S1 RNA-binding domain-containing protein [Clostridia bacterium]